MSVKNLACRAFNKQSEQIFESSHLIKLAFKCMYAHMLSTDHTQLLLLYTYFNFANLIQKIFRFIFEDKGK